MKKIHFLILLIILAGPFILHAQSPGEGTLTFYTDQFNDSRGKAVILLFKKGDDVPSSPFMKAGASIIDGKSVIVFEYIPYGEFAAILFHDENDNGILDHAWGLPNEPKGFSNDWKLTLTSGMPDFSKLKFLFSPSTPACHIHIQ